MADSPRSAPDYSLRAASPAKTRAEAVVVGVLEGRKGPTLADGGEDVAAAYGRKLRPLLASLGITGKQGDVARVPVGDQLATPLLVLVGLGDAATPDAVRRAAGVAARSVPNATSVALALPATTPELVRAVVEGHVLGGYTFTAYSSAPPPPRPGTVLVLTPRAKDPEFLAAFEQAQVVAEATVVTRDWVNTPPNDLTPPRLAETIAARVADVDGITVQVHDEDALADLGCGGILAVGGGSAAPPRLVELTYAPTDATVHLALVGKGITFDSGGLWIKPSSSMATMKSDMAGAAAVVNATVAIARLGLPVKVSTFVPIAENMIGGAAMRPGDVITAYGGTTVEIINTDAEGRLVLADALVRATETKPDVLLDVATLTGHMVTALGDRITGVLGSPEIVDAVREAGESAGEAHWPMPIPETMDERIRSSRLADLTQYDGIRWGGGLFAAAFLREFTAGLPWGHLDIAGPSWNGGAPYGHLTSGGTGVSVATLVEYARLLGS